MSAHISKETIVDNNLILSQEYRTELVREFERAYARHIFSPKILLIGGAGYIGSVLCQHLLDCGYSVRSLDLLLYGQDDLIAPFMTQPGFEFIKGDFVVSETLNKALDGVTDVVVLAGLVGDPITKKYPEFSHAINDEGMMRLIQALKGCDLNKLIFVSTCSNYGLIPEDALASEDFELKPLSLYAKSKVAIEQEILSLKGRVRFSPVILRFATAFGLSPRMRFDLTINEFVREAFLENDLLVYDAKTWRPYCHVRDLSLVIRRALEAPVSRVNFEVFNVGGNENNLTKEMVVNEIRRFIPAMKVTYKEHGGDPRNYRVNFSKIRDRLFFEPHYRAADGISEILMALQKGAFSDHDRRKSFYGNHTIEYRLSNGRI